MRSPRPAESIRTTFERLYAERGDLQPYGRALFALALTLQKDRRASEVATEIERTARTDNRTSLLALEPPGPPRFHRRGSNGRHCAVVESAHPNQTEQSAVAACGSLARV